VASNKQYVGGLLLATVGCYVALLALMITLSPVFLVTLLAALGLFGVAVQEQ